MTTLNGKPPQKVKHDYALVLREMREKGGFTIADLRPEVRNKTFRTAIEKGDPRALRELRNGWGFTHRDVCDKSAIILPESQDSYREIVRELREWGFIPESEYLRNNGNA